MTEIPDGRVAAWVCAWDNLRAAREFSAEHNRERPGVPLPEPYWAAIAEAAVFAEMARTDIAVGVAAGTLIDDREVARQRADDFIAEVFARAKDAQQ